MLAKVICCNVCTAIFTLLLRRIASTFPVSNCPALQPDHERLLHIDQHSLRDTDYLIRHPSSLLLFLLLSFFLVFSSSFTVSSQNHVSHVYETFFINQPRHISHVYEISFIRVFIDKYCLLSMSRLLRLFSRTSCPLLLGPVQSLIPAPHPCLPHF